MQDNLGRIINLPKMVDPRGNLTVAEQLKDVPFSMSRASSKPMCATIRAVI